MAKGHTDMRDDIHEQALELIDKRQVEGLSAQERDRLEAHLEE